MNMKSDFRKIILIPVLFSLFSLLFFSSCANRFDKDSERIFLKSWSYSLDGVKYNDIPGRTLESIHKLVPGEKGFITLHTEFELPWKMMSDDIGLVLGKILVAAKIFLNGQEIGTVGNFPPNIFNAGQCFTNIKLNPKFLKIDAPNTLEIVLWVEGKGGVSDIPFVSSYQDTLKFSNRMTFIYSKLNLIFVWTMILTTIAFYMFYWHQRKDKQFKNYAFMNFWTAFYLFPSALAEFPNFIGIMPYVWWLKLLEGCSAVIVTYYATSFIRSFLGVKSKKIVEYVRVGVLGLILVYVLCIPSVHFFYTKIYILAGLLFIQLLFGIPNMIIEMFRKNPAVKKLLLGFSPVILTVCIDFFIKVFLKLEMAPLITIYGWQMTVLTFLAIVTKRYAKIRVNYEYLNENLEKEVKQRTMELTLANEELEKRQAEADRDMALAVHVQQSFYPKEIKFSGWDVGVSFNPLSGVSGDLYDFFKMDGKLRGFSLFDVSGHGISSGLVTMLAKNAIFHSFRNSLSMKLDEAMELVNNNVISVKGEIENYLAGVLFRIDKDNPNALEFVNAGGPHPIFKSKSKKKNAELLLPDEKKPHYGMIGVSGLAVKFQVIKKKMKPGDVLVLYTDGISETENYNGEPFGKERIMEILNKVEGSAQEIVDAIMQNLRDFADYKNIDDDITILVMKKTEDDDTIDDVLELETL